MLRKGREGWEAKDILDFEGNRKLSISTHKINGKMVSNASVSTYLEDGTMSHVFGGDGGDFSKHLIVNRGARCTEKTVTEQHKVAMSMLPEVLAAAKAHYLKYPAEA